LNPQGLPFIGADYFRTLPPVRGTPKLIQVLPSRSVISPGLVTCRLEVLDRPPQGCLFDQLGRFAGRHPDAAPLLLFRPITLLPAYLQWKDLDVADHRLLSFQSSRAELANVLFAYRSAHAGFFVGLDRCRLLRRAVLDRPAFRHRPSALFPGGDQQDFESLFRMRYGTAANCLNFTDYPPKAAAT
jgi:hypothetical protein